MPSGRWPSFKVRTRTFTARELTIMRRVVWGPDNVGATIPRHILDVAGNDSFFIVGNEGGTCGVVGPDYYALADLPQLNARTVRRIFNL